jgi:uncharacterized protein YggE
MKSPWIATATLLLLGSLAKARAQNDTAVRSVLAAIYSFQVDPTDVQTDFIQGTVRHNDSAETVVDHDIVEKSIAVTLKDISKFEPLLSAVLEAGANHIYQVEFMTTELRKYRDQAWYGRLNRGGVNAAQNVYQTGDRGSTEGTVALGKISVTASVSMNFRME